MSGTSSFLTRAQNKCIQVLHLEHSIMGRPANGRLQKHVTKFHDSSSKTEQEEEGNGSLEGHT